MSQLLLAVYRGEDTAEHVLGVLRAQDHVFATNLQSVAVVRLRRDSTFTVSKARLARSTASFWGVFWEALFGVIYGVPNRSPSTSSSLGQLFDMMERAGLDERFRGRVRRALRRGSSALGLYALDGATEPWICEPLLRPHTSVCARLVPDRDVKLLRELGWYARDDMQEPRRWE